MVSRQFGRPSSWRFNIFFAKTQTSLTIIEGTEPNYDWSWMVSSLELENLLKRFTEQPSIKSIILLNEYFLGSEDFFVSKWNSLSANFINSRFDLSILFFKLQSGIVVSYKSTKGEVFFNNPTRWNSRHIHL